MLLLDRFDAILSKKSGTIPKLRKANPLHKKAVLLDKPKLTLK